MYRKYQEIKIIKNGKVYVQRIVDNNGEITREQHVSDQNQTQNQAAQPNQKPIPYNS